MPPPNQGRHGFGLIDGSLVWLKDGEELAGLVFPVPDLDILLYLSAFVTVLMSFIRSVIHLSEGMLWVADRFTYGFQGFGHS